MAYSLNQEIIYKELILNLRLNLETARCSPEADNKTNNIEYDVIYVTANFW